MAHLEIRMAEMSRGTNPACRVSAEGDATLFAKDLSSHFSREKRRTFSSFYNDMAGSRGVGWGEPLVSPKKR